MLEIEKNIYFFFTLFVDLPRNILFPAFSSGIPIYLCDTPRALSPSFCLWPQRGYTVG